MRQYLPIISLVLAMWPLTHVKAEDFWVNIQGSDCKLWSDEAQTDQDIVSWSGECKQGKASGEGSLVWKTAGKLVGTYDGIMKEGRFHNYGVVKIASETGGFDEIEGIFTNGVIDGGGIFKDSAGNIYEGELKDGVPHGVGYSKEEELEYVGNFENGKREGFGFQISDTEAYFGEFDKGEANGSGILEDSEGGRYHGQFKDNKPHGFGTYTTKEGGVYQGQFVNGKADGQFLVTTDASSGSVVEAWKDGEKVK